MSVNTGPGERAGVLDCGRPLPLCPRTGVKCALAEPQPKRQRRVLGHVTTWRFRRGHFQDAPLSPRGSSWPNCNQTFPARSACIVWNEACLAALGGLKGREASLIERLNMVRNRCSFVLVLVTAWISVCGCQAGELAVQRLVTFSYSDDDTQPTSLIQGSDGSLYGTTRGSVATGGSPDDTVFTDGFDGTP